MRLLVFDEILFSGGVETLCFNLLPGLSELCEQVVWCVPDHLREDFQRRTAGAGRLKLEGHNRPAGGRALMYSMAKRAAGVMGSACAVARLSRDGRIRELVRKHRCTHFLTTCVFDQSFPGIDLPVFGFVCDVNPEMPPDARLNIGRWVEKAAAIFGISRFTCDELRRLHRVPDGKIHAIPLAAAPVRHGMSAGAGKFDFYYPAAPNPHKNHLTLFKACVQLAQAGREFRLVLSGPGTECFRDGEFSNPKMCEARDCLRGHAHLLNGRIEVKGDVGAQGVDDLYEQARCVVLPSGYEGFGLPLAEALQRGMPVICSDIPAHREQLEDYNPVPDAALVPSGDASALAVAMADFLDKKIPMEEMRRGGASRKFRWTWNDAARRCLEVMTQTQPANR